MSTKIYVAYKLKDGKDLYAFMRSVRPQVVMNIRTTLHVLGLDYLVSKEGKEQAENRGYDILTPINVYEWLRENYRNQKNNSERDLFDFDVSLNFYRDGQSYYFIPYGDILMKDVWKFLEKNKWVTDFAYWNNVDKPKKITQKAWDKRGEIWDKIHESYDPLCLTWEVCSLNNFYQIFDRDNSFREQWQKLKDAKEKINHKQE